MFLIQHQPGPGAWSRLTGNGCILTPSRAATSSHSPVASAPPPPRPRLDYGTEAFRHFVLLPATCSSLNPWLSLEIIYVILRGQCGGAAGQGQTT